MFLLDLIIKTAILGIIVFASGKILFSRDSEWKLFLWKSFFVIVLFLPFLLFYVPDIQVPIIIQLHHANTQEEHIPKVFKKHEFLGDYRLSSDNQIISAEPDPLVSSNDSSTGNLPSVPPLYLIWFVGFAAVSAWLISGHFQIAKTRKKGNLINSSALREICTSLCQDMQISKSVDLYISPSTSVPFTSGVRKPYIVVPEEFIQLPDKSIELSLRHELEHIRRNDNLWNYLVNLACALFWFNPVIWVIAALYRTFREKSVDEKIVRNGVNAAEYAHLLVNVAAQAKKQPGFILNAVMVSKVSSLKDRIISILYTDNDGQSCKPINKAMILTVLVAVTLVVSALTPVDFVNNSDKVNKAFQTELKHYSQEHVEAVFSELSLIDQSLEKASLTKLRKLVNSYPYLRDLRYLLIDRLLKNGKHQEANRESAIVDRLSKDRYSAKRRLAAYYSQRNKIKIAFHWLYLAACQESDLFDDIHRWRSFSNVRKSRRFNQLKMATEKHALPEIRNEYVLENLLKASKEAELPAPVRGPTDILGTIAANDPDHNHRELSIELLGGLGTPNAYLAIENALVTEIDPDIIETAFESMDSFPDEFIATRIEATSNLIDNPWAIVHSTELLAKVNPEKAATGLLNVLLVKTDHECHKYAVYMLSRIPEHGKKALEEIAQHHPSESMKSRAKRYLYPERRNHQSDRW